MKAPGVIGIVLLFAAGTVAPASANWFSNPYLGINRNIGSAPNPTPDQIRQERLGEHGLFVNNGPVANAEPALSDTGQKKASDQTYEQQKGELAPQASAEAGAPATVDGQSGPL